MSELLKMYNALEDQILRRRIQGAVVKQAQYLVNLADAPPASLALAVQVIASPFTQIQAFVLEAVGNTTVLDQIKFGPDGQTTYSQGVPDSDLEYVVGAVWEKVAGQIASAQAPDAGTLEA